MDSFSLYSLLSVTIVCVLVGEITSCSEQTDSSNLASTMEQHKVVPEVIDAVPKQVLEVKYGSLKVNLGNELTPTQVKDKPTISWPVEKGAHYTLIMTDPDAPAAMKEIKHWLVGNIPGTDISKGKTIAEYISSGPSKGSGIHRYIFLVYKEPEQTVFDESYSSNRSVDHRTNFFVRKFAEKYKLGQPIAGNFYLAQYDDYVPILHSQFTG